MTALVHYCTGAECCTDCEVGPCCAGSPQRPSDKRKTLGLAKKPVAVPLWVLTDLIMAAEQGSLSEPSKDACRAARKAIRNLEATE